MYAQVYVYRKREIPILKRHHLIRIHASTNRHSVHRHFRDAMIMHKCRDDDENMKDLMALELNRKMLKKSSNYKSSQE